MPTTNQPAEHWDALAEYEEQRMDPSHWDHSPSAKNRAALYRKTAAAIREDQPLLAVEGIEELIKERNDAEAQAQVEELNRILRTPIADVSKKAGDIERNSPLFGGTGENPTLF